MNKLKLLRFVRCLSQGIYTVFLLSTAAYTNAQGITSVLAPQATREISGEDDPYEFNRLVIRYLPDKAPSEIDRFVRGASQFYRFRLPEILEPDFMIEAVIPENEIYLRIFRRNDRRSGYLFNIVDANLADDGSGGVVAHGFIFSSPYFNTANIRYGVHEEHRERGYGQHLLKLLLRIFNKDMETFAHVEKIKWFSPNPQSYDYVKVHMYWKKHGGPLYDPKTNVFQLSS